MDDFSLPPVDHIADAAEAVEEHLESIATSPMPEELPQFFTRGDDGILRDAMGIAEGEFGFGAWQPEWWEMTAL